MKVIRTRKLETHISGVGLQTKPWAMCWWVAMLDHHLKLLPHNADCQDVGNLRTRGRTHPAFET